VVFAFGGLRVCLVFGFDTCGVLGVLCFLVFDFLLVCALGFLIISSISGFPAGFGCF